MTPPRRAVIEDDEAEVDEDEYLEDFDEDEYEDEYEDGEDWDGLRPRWSRPPKELGRGVALGLVAVLPLLLFYEWAAGVDVMGRRNAAEVVLFRFLAPLGEHAQLARQVLLGALVLGAGLHCLRRHWALGPALLRVILEGAIAAVLIGPLLISLLHLFGDHLPPLPMAQGAHPDLVQVGLVLGAGAYEELLFRVVLYSALYVLSRRLLRFLGAARPVAAWSSELLALVLSSLAFAAFHLAFVLQWVGAGEEFHLAVFTYRALAGILLGILFRLRGPGVAAWTHAFFNLALILGAGPDVFL